MAGTAVLSSCGSWRYRLERDVGGAGEVAAIIAVNPSTATADIDDQTIRKDLGFARELGWRRIIKGNKFAFRATDVNDLAGAADPVGPDNDQHLEQIMRDADVHVVAWGRLGKLPTRLRTRWKQVASIADKVGCRLMCWGVTKDGHPRHPLYLRYTAELVAWDRP